MHFGHGCTTCTWWPTLVWVLVLTEPLLGLLHHMCLENVAVCVAAAIRVRFGRETLRRQQRMIVGPGRAGVVFGIIPTTDTSCCTPEGWWRDGW